MNDIYPPQNPEAFTLNIDADPAKVRRTLREEVATSSGKQT